MLNAFWWLITAEAVGTASTDGETKGDFALDWPVDKAADVSVILDGTVTVPVIEGSAAFTGASPEVRVFSGRDASDSGQLQFDVALTAEVITATYAVAAVETQEQERRIVVEDETVGFVTSVGNNIKARDNVKALTNVGIFSSADAV